MPNGKTDVKLLDKQVKVEAWDLCVDATDRRKDTTTPHRRALVHDFEDGLTVNWGGDYPGGVTINGTKVRVVGKLEITPQTFHAPAPTGVLTRHDPTGGAVVGTGTPDTLPAAVMASYLGSGPVDVIEALSKLFAEIDSLKQQLAKVQENWRWCKKCRCLFFAGNPANGKECPAGGQHTQEGSGNYRLLHK